MRRVQITPSLHTLFLICNTFYVEPVAVRSVEVSTRPSDLLDGMHATKKDAQYSEDGCGTQKTGHDDDLLREGA